MPAIQKTYVDLTTVVPAEWFNRLQKHLAGFMNLKVSVSGAVVTVAGASSNGVASIYIGGEMRRNDTNVTFTFTGESAGTYGVHAVATAAVDTFAVEVALGAAAPATSPYRKIADVDWSGSAITALRGVRGTDIDDHDHSGYAQPQISHTDATGGATGDPHPQYMLPDGSRPFTGTVTGVTPVATADLATKAYADGLLLTVPIGAVFYWPTEDAAPSGFLIPDGSAVSRTTYSALFSVIGTTYGTGDGSTTFNLPDLRGRMVLGDSGSTSLNQKGGSLGHTHTQAGHTHTQDSHSHTSPTHTHTGAATGSDGSHTHTQGATGSDSVHTHSGPSHSHGASGIGLSNSGAAGYVSRTTDASASGLFQKNDLDEGDDGTSHSHSDGSYSASGVPVTGTSASASGGHTHAPATNSYAHTHDNGTASGTTSSNSATTGNSSTTHTHTNPTTASGGSHSHSSGGNTGTAAPTTDSGGAVATGSGGADATGSATIPYLSVKAIIRAT